ncbi:xanthine dehydrogenase family protein molybdopterin-binding subunit [Dyadobacter flavalbus]|uniref:Xanthine dehydrogenase family protein molybdopterin-binding subunit n=1 Tax=Dyadobacter flavalbus TaxID=2579942 RepID=A0A5M8QSH3_9BACT|nr:xanthine dehydrogenase family protein molybdopterin-binding subunit [Dyadobacter flavalbus]KAA6439039.1 xanthine dehydrogenase family protein molybdopterin-binding subunit [Dyadobacter flavalbus]
MDKNKLHYDPDKTVSRIEGKAKVTGTARYAAEYKPEGTLYGVLVTSTISKGSIKDIDSKKAESSPGVVTVLTHLNRPDVPGWNKEQKAQSRVEGQEFRVFFDNRIYYNHQPVALVIADTLERAGFAAGLVNVTYHKEPHQTDFTANRDKAYKPKRTEDYSRGSDLAFQSAAVQIKAEYTTPLQVHNPMEMHAATVEWKASGKLTDYNKTQAVKMARKEIATAFDIQEDAIEVHAPFVGGAFGSSSRVWPQEMAALLGARKVGRPVKVMAKRDQVFNMVGYRPASVQQFSIGAEKNGTLTAIRHEVIGSTSAYEEFTERITDPTRSLYACPNLHTTYKLLALDMSTPCWTRGPGETSGSFALECAMDELSYALKMDPVELRLKNFAEKDPESGLDWSSNYLKACLQKAGESFGWGKRNPVPGSMTSDGWQLGMGMSSGIYKSDRSPATASATLRPDGSLVVQSSVADVGPGSATVMTQIAADAFGTRISKVEFQWGNSMFPTAPGQFGSHTTASVGSAVHDAVKALQKRLKELAANTENAPLYGRNTDDLVVENGMVTDKEKQGKWSFSELLSQNKLSELKVTTESRSGNEKEQFSGKSFCAHFVEVLVHPLTGTVKVSRVVTAIDAGRIINHKTATSQVYGSVIWGIGVSLLEEGIVDHRFGRYVNNDLASYHLPVNADVPSIEVIFIDKPDPVINPMGTKGLGEIGIVGFSAAVANAVYHATGKRVRSLPITADKLI